jgi:hypothetical protein
MKRKTGSATEEIIEAHASLNADLKRLEEAALPASRRERWELAAQLHAARADLVEHFRLEEHGGYMDSVRQREPRLERTVKELADEHGQLLRALDALLAQARAPAGKADPLGENIRAWVASVRRHEAREIDLVQEAFNVDVSTDD